METFNFKGHTVIVIRGYDGKQMFINDAAGNQIYAMRFEGDARTWAAWVMREAK